MRDIFKILLLLFCLNACSLLTNKEVEVWVSTADQTQNLDQKENIVFSGYEKNGSDTSYCIKVDEDSVFQKWIGCGACTNDASAWLIYKKLDTAPREKLMRQLFDKNAGIGMDWVLHQMGAGDAAVINGGWWTYDDVPKGETDPELKHFTIENERDYILPMVKDAKTINKNLKIVGCPWTPPVWMKTSSVDTIGHNAYTYGQVRPEFYEALANYFVKFIKAYEAEGLPVYGIAIQNEPLVEPGIKCWQGCKIFPEAEATLISKYFGPAFQKNNISTRIYCFDHDWDQGMKYVSLIYNDTAASKYVTGSMWHHYNGKPDTMTRVHNKFPEKEIWFTEGCGSIWTKGNYGDYNTYEGSFLNFTWNEINVIRNWSQTMMMYQIALDTAHGPAALGSPPMNYAMVTVNQRNGALIYRPEYYVLGHVSKFVVPDAYRIGSNQYPGKIENTAFKNPDGSIVLVVASRLSTAADIQIQWKSKSIHYKMPPKSMITFKWN
jgi:glucosylceramidase